MLKIHSEPPSISKSCERCPIRQRTICSAIPTDQLEILEEFKSCDRILPVRSHLYRAGEKSSEIYHLLSGWVVTYRILESGRRQILQIELPGAFLGYQSGLEDPMLSGAQCITDVAVCVFPRRGFPALLERHPAMIKKLINSMARQVERGQDHLTNVGSRAGLERVARFLLQIYFRVVQDQSSENEDTLLMPLTQEMIADALGLTSVHINRILRELRERHLVMMSNGMLRIMDRAGLQEMAELPQLGHADA